LIITWLGGLLSRRSGRLLGISAGIALAVALIAALGAFLTTSQSIMTARALRSVAVDWQVELQPSANTAEVLRQVAAAPEVTAALPVQFAAVKGFQTTVGGTTQTTGAGVVLGLPPDYRGTFGQQIRTMTGADTGVLLAQQTAANLRARPGDTIRIERAGRPAVSVAVAGVVNLPFAGTLFQKVGAPPQSQPSVPPDNVLLLPSATFTKMLSDGPFTVQIHVARRAPAQSSPAGAYKAVVEAGHKLEAQLAGAGVIGNDVGAALDAARSDAAYAQMLFLFLGLPGAVLAALLTAALAGAGATRRRSEQIAPLTGRLARPGAAAFTRQRRLLARSIVLLALAVSFAVSIAVFSATYRQQVQADAQLTNGADVTVIPAPGTRAAPGQVAALAAISGVHRVEPIQHRFAYVGANLQDLYGVRPGTITTSQRCKTPISRAAAQPNS
jgi:putative ABC transport system permease protein